MGLELVEGAVGDPRNARYLAMACDLAYFDEAEAAPRFREELGLEARLISVGNTQVYVGRNDRSVVVAFRGSQAPTTLDGLKDWFLTNANDLLVLPEGRAGTDFAAAGVGARFHRGFLEALADVWDPLYAAVDTAMKEKERPLWVTGHSLGGALALLAAWRLQQNFIPVYQVYTFGAPMIGNAEASKAYQREFPDKIYRFVDGEDPVPLLPTVSLVANAYDHCLNEVLLGAAQAAGAASSALQGAAGQAAEGLLQATLIDELWGKTTARISRHLITNYHERIAEKCGPNG
ncbi:MAG: lipase family protein [Isosphaeraceae bacterium]